MTRQVHSYFTATKPVAPAGLMRDLVEIDLAKTFNWTPMEIAQIPYRWIQKFYLIERVKKETIETKTQIAKFKNENTVSRGSGASRVPSPKMKGKKFMVAGFDKVVTSNKSSKQDKKQE